MKPRLKPFVHFFRKNNSIYQFYDWGRHKSIDIESQLNLKSIIPLFTGELTIEEIEEKLLENTDTIKELIKDLHSIGLIIDQREIETNINEKNSRLIESFLPFLNEKRTISNILRDLSKAKVVLLGLGGVGSWVYEMLLKQEIGEIHIIDPDRVELSNIHRQALYTENDVGDYKVEVALREGKRINSEAKVVTYKNLISKFDDMYNLRLPENIDLFICCGDYPSVSEISMITSKYCFEKSIPHIVNSGYNGSLANLPQTVIPGNKDSACLKCYHNKYDNSLGEFVTVGPGGASFGPLAAMAGELIALEAIKVLTDYTKPSFYNKRGEFDTLEVDFKFINVAKDPDCILCKSYI